MGKLSLQEINEHAGQCSVSKQQSLYFNQNTSCSWGFVQIKTMYTQKALQAGLLTAFASVPRSQDTLGPGGASALATQT